jgi:hypothetical protein
VECAGSATTIGAAVLSEQISTNSSDRMKHNDGSRLRAFSIKQLGPLTIVYLGESFTIGQPVLASSSVQGKSTDMRRRHSTTV